MKSVVAVLSVLMCAVLGEVPYDGVPSFSLNRVGVVGPADPAGKDHDNGYNPYGYRNYKAQRLFGHDSFTENGRVENSGFFNGQIIAGPGNPDNNHLFGHRYLGNKGSTGHGYLVDRHVVAEHGYPIRNGDDDYPDNEHDYPVNRHVDSAYDYPENKDLAGHSVLVNGHMAGERGNSESKDFATHAYPGNRVFIATGHPGNKDVAEHGYPVSGHQNARRPFLGNTDFIEQPYPGHKYFAGHFNVEHPYPGNKVFIGHPVNNREFLGHTYPGIKDVKGHAHLGNKDNAGHVYPVNAHTDSLHVKRNDGHDKSIDGGSDGHLYKVNKATTGHGGTHNRHDEPVKAFM